MFAVRHARVGSLRIGERKDVVDDGLDLAGVDQRPDFAQQRVADRAFLLLAARAQGWWPAATAASSASARSSHSPACRS